MAARPATDEGATVSEQDRYIPGVPCWVDINVPDVEAGVAFYGGLFGWEFEDVTPPGAPVSYSVALLPGGTVAGVASQPAGTDRAVAWDTYVWVDDADAAAGKVRAAGGSVLSEPADTGDSGRTALCADPEGASFCLWQAREHRGAGVVNEPGSLNFNDLRTRDLEGARAFYGAVFGWEVLDLGGGYAWALPGYGDFLEQRKPGMRAGMAAMGAPDRFEDVVASVTQISDDTSPHWGVIFAVDDADAIAARATALGGRVIVAPFDAPWVRTTVLADPQGATFTASKFVPENAGSGGATDPA
jgi:predicted enzyme related to lactoylglutathione lyase